MPHLTNSLMSLIRMVCPVCNGANTACGVCDEQGRVEFWLPDEQIPDFQHDPCIVLHTVPVEDVSYNG